NPIDPGLFLVRGQPLQAIIEATVHRIARVALRHDHEVGVDLVLHVDGGAIARDGLVQRNDADAGTLGASLSLDRLIIDPNAGEAGANTFAPHASDRHDAAVAGVAIHDHWELHGLGDPARHLDALKHRQGADIGQTCIAADHAAGANEADFATSFL